jgi:hypothetical protein
MAPRAFDINLPLAGTLGAGTLGIECRDGGALKDYQVVFTFPAALVSLSGATVTPGPGGSGSLDGDPIIDGGQVTVNLTNVSNAQTVTITLLGVNDGINTYPYDVPIPMGVLIGDTAPDGSVDSADVTLTRQQVGKTVTDLNFREDVTVDGSINRSDVSVVNKKTGPTCLDGYVNNADRVTTSRVSSATERGALAIASQVSGRSSHRAKAKISRQRQILERCIIDFVNASQPVDRALRRAMFVSPASFRAIIWHRAAERSIHLPRSPFK